MPGKGEHNRLMLSKLWVPNWSGGCGESQGGVSHGRGFLLGSGCSQGLHLFSIEIVSGGPMICGSQGYWTVTFSLEWRMFHQVVNIFHLVGVLVLQMSSRILFCMSLTGRTHSKRPWCWERLKVGGEGDDRGWGGWMASPTQWTWVWASSRSWWWTGRPGMLQYKGSQRVRHDWATELNW